MKLTHCCNLKSVILDPINANVVQWNDEDVELFRLPDIQSYLKYIWDHCAVEKVLPELIVMSKDDVEDLVG